MKKKVFAGLLVLSMAAVAVVGCGKKEAETEAPKATEAVTEAKETEAAATEAAATEAAATEAATTEAAAAEAATEAVETEAAPEA